MTTEESFVKARALGLKLACAGFAGLVGVTLTFPLDVAKYRIQTEEIVAGQQKKYRNMFQTVLTINRKEGFSALFGGIEANLKGIILEKAIKIGVNEQLRDHFRDSNGRVSTAHGCLSGGIAGACQMVITNPMELIKIKQQKMTDKGIKTTAMAEIRKLGYKNLYAGWQITLIRDVPFSVIFFAINGELEDRWVLPSGTPAEQSVKSFAASCFAGAVAAFCSTPADVIKTRVQSNAEPRSVPFSEIVGVARNMLATEGASAFFLGAGLRVFVIAPLFGFTFLSYNAQKKIMQHMGWV